MTRLPKEHVGVQRRWGRGDIEPPGPPAVSADQWHDSAAVLALYRAWAERHATQAITWYLQDKRIKRLGSRFLRAGAIVLAAAGGLAPLARGDTTLGYMFLALAASCVAFDHFFGLSSGWMREIATAQALQSRFARFQLDWMNWQAVEAGLIKLESPDEEPAEGIRYPLELIHGLVTDVLRLTEDETALWMQDLSNSIVALQRQASPAGALADQSVTQRSGAAGSELNAAQMTRRTSG